MKLVTVVTVVLALSVSSCRNTALKLGSGGSTLQGVYDDEYSLRIGRVSGEANLYQFETCFTAAHLSKQGSSLSPEKSCVPALLEDRGESITFNVIPAADKLALSEEEQRSLLKMQREWGEYREKQAYFNPIRVIGGVSGAGAVIGSTASIAGLSLKAKEAQAGLRVAEAKGQEIWDRDLLNLDTEEPNWYKKVLGTVDKESAVEEMVKTEEKLKAYGYSTASPSGIEIGSKGHIYSDEFIDFLKNSTEITEFLAKNNVQKDILSILADPYEYAHYYDDAFFEYLVGKFLHSKYKKIPDIIDPEFLDRFMEFRQKDRIYKDYKDPRRADWYARDRLLSTKKLHEDFVPLGFSDEVARGDLKMSRLINKINSFAENKGIPRDVLNDINKNKAILENLKQSFPDSVLKNTSMNLSDMLDSFKKSEAYMNPARKLAKESAKKIARVMRTAVAVMIVGGATTVALLHLAGKEAREAKGALDKKELKFDNLSVLLQESSPLTSMDPYNNVQVPSIKDVLTYLSISWGGVNFESDATYYCFPELEDKNTVTADCEPQGYSRRGGKITP